MISEVVFFKTRKNAVVSLVAGILILIGFKLFKIIVGDTGRQFEQLFMVILFLLESVLILHAIVNLKAKRAVEIASAGI